MAYFFGVKAVPFSLFLPGKLGGAVLKGKMAPPEETSPVFHSKAVSGARFGHSPPHTTSITPCACTARALPAEVTAAPRGCPAALMARSRRGPDTPTCVSPRASCTPPPRCMGQQPWARGTGQTVVSDTELPVGQPGPGSGTRARAQHMGTQRAQPSSA